LGIGLGQSEKLCAALDRDDAGGLQKHNEPLPRKVLMGRSSIYKVEAEATAK
jgi:hypothetical protein